MRDNPYPAALDALVRDPRIEGAGVIAVTLGLDPLVVLATPDPDATIRVAAVRAGLEWWKRHRPPVGR